MQFDKNSLSKRHLIFNGRHLPYSPDLKQQAKELRKNMTKAERKLWFEYLKHHQIKFIAQHPIDNFIVDFYSPEQKLIIEVDGSQHYTSEGKEYDDNRTKVLNLFELEVLRFTNQDVLYSFDSVCQSIETYLNRSTK